MSRLFQLQENCLRLMGHNLESSGVPGSFSLGLKHIASLLFVLSAEYPMLSYVIYHRDDMELITACLSVAFTNLVTVTKIWTFLLYKPNFGQMMQRFRQLDSKSQKKKKPSPAQLEDGGNGYLARANKLAASLGRAYCISCGFTGLYFMLGPIIKIITSSWRGVPYARELPMPMKFPFNDVDSPGYEFGFIYTLFVTIVVVLYASAVDGLFITFAINLRAHFQALQQDIRELNFDQAEQLVQRQLVEVVDYQVLLLDLCRRLRRIYTPIVFGQFFITSLEVGVIIYQIVTHMDSIMALLVYFSFFCSIMLQLFMYCYGGEIIKVESLQVGIAIQTSNWHLALPKQRRSLVFMMHRSQREMLIKAGFYEASLANFLAICRAALSFITLIQSIE
ncbi:odorant receptor 82a [Drosophila novamexicana]|uniref:odorant receptor 82a n=1 Tax=Drosophila novamexicana TaxID=47314 RepID=UPI0011E58C02|nr:odorant receptor 82a [Drosophila novamexicana]